MCPSYRATRNEKDVTRGRANTLRLAISGQLGPDALASDEMMETLKLCVSCKACRHECPVGVDMAKMKIEVLAARAARHGLSLHDRLVGYLPRYAGLAARLAPLANWRNNSPLLRRLLEKIAGISARRTLPQWRHDVFRSDAAAIGPADGHEVVLFADTFNGAYERENLEDALRVLVAGGYRVHMPRPLDGGRPLCCGRTFLSAGLVDHARAELDRLVSAYAPFAQRGVPIVGLEPSCLLTLRDELLSLRSDASAKSVSAQALLFEEFLVREAEAGRLQLPLGPVADEDGDRREHVHPIEDRKIVLRGSDGEMGLIREPCIDDNANGGARDDARPHRRRGNDLHDARPGAGRDCRVCLPDAIGGDGRGGDILPAVRPVGDGDAQLDRMRCIDRLAERIPHFPTQKRCFVPTDSPYFNLLTVGPQERNRLRKAAPAPPGPTSDFGFMAMVTEVIDPDEMETRAVVSLHPVLLSERRTVVVLSTLNDRLNCPFASVVAVCVPPA